MQKSLFFLFSAAFLFFLCAYLIACDDDDDDDDDDDGSTDDTGDDDTADGDPLGSAGDNPCIQPLSEELIACKTGCPDPGEVGHCEFNYCLWGCYAVMFQGAVDCADEYPELEQYVPMWTCHRDCDEEMLECLEPLDTCDNDRYYDCSDAMAACDHEC